jgi:sporulation protein YunB
LRLNRKRFYKKGPLPFRYVFLLTIVFFIFSTAIGIWTINKGIAPTLMDAAQKETERIASLVINNAVGKQIAEDEINVDDLIITSQNTTGNITSFKFNTTMISRILAKMTNRVQKNLQLASKGNIAALEMPDVEIETKGHSNEGILYEIPLGQATHNALLGNLGPKIPVRFYVVGSVEPNITKEIIPYPINNAYIEIDVHIKVSIQVVIPFLSKTTYVETSIPIGITTYQGDVPDYYNGGDSSSAPSIQFPRSK